jgi:hypothetical protein
VSITDPNVFQIQKRDMESLAILASIRQVYLVDMNIYRIGVGKEVAPRTFRQSDKLLASTHDGKLIDTLSGSISLLQHPADTGFAFFLRHHANTWTLNNILSVFESALFISRWIEELAKTRSYTYPCQKVVGKLREIMSMAWSSLDDSYSPRDFMDEKTLASTVLLYWGRVLEGLIEKPYARMLGRTLCSYADAIVLPTVA